MPDLVSPEVPSAQFRKAVEQWADLSHPIEITPEMIAAGKRTLLSSGALEYECLATDKLVKDILWAALTALRYA